MSPSAIMRGSVLILLVLSTVFVTRGFSIVSPRPGLGLKLPVDQSERLARHIGLPGPVAARFIVSREQGYDVLLIEGIYPVPVLMGQYSNSTGSYSGTEFQEHLFDGPNPTGTMKQYYDEISFELLDLQGSVYGWYTVPETGGYYEGSNNGFGPYPRNAAGFVYDLVEASDATVDYSPFDNDGPDGIPNSGDDDGYVDSFFAVHTGNGGECSGSSHIWSHSWSISSSGGPSGGYETSDPSASGGFIHVNSYIIMPELNCSENDINAIGVYCHEFGHALGLPDLYDGDGSSEGIGGWGLMGSGSWGGDQNHPETPVHMTAWSKARLGWIEPVELNVNTPVLSLPRAEDSPTAVKVWRDGDYTGTEYFLIENRQKVGFDASLILPGVMIWHIDDSRPNNNNELQKLVDMEEADGLEGLNQAGNRGDSGDPWPGSTGNRAFDWFSLPNSNSYYGFRTEVSVTNISDPDSLMNVKLTIRSAMIDSLEWNLDDSGGDADGVWDIGEAVNLFFTVYNSGGTAAENLWAAVSSEDSTIEIQTDSLFIGTLEGFSSIGNAGGDPIVLSSDPGAAVHSTSFTLSMRGQDNFEWSISLDVLIGHPGLLIVDDSEEGSDYLEYYSATLDTLHVPYVARNVALQGSPADSLEPFGLVIWFSGNEEDTILDPLDIAALEAHLERGGRLFLTGQNIAEDLHNRGESFLGDFLKAGWSGTKTTPFAYGLRGDPITDSVQVIITGGTKGANNQTSRDILDVQPGGQAIVVYDTTAVDEAAGLSVRFTEYETKLVFLGFGFEAVNRPASDPDHVTRVEFMDRILDWLMTPVGIKGDEGNSPDLPFVYDLGQNYPNQFNPSTTIDFTFPSSGGTEHTKLIVYSLRGKLVRTLVDEDIPPGSYEVVWDGLDDRGVRVSSGVYFYTLTRGELNTTRKMLVIN